MALVLPLEGLINYHYKKLDNKPKNLSELLDYYVFIHEIKYEVWNKLMLRVESPEDGRSVMDLLYAVEHMIEQVRNELLIHLE